MTKSLRKAVMIRTKMKNNYNKKHTQESLNSNKKQQNFCINLLRKTKKDYISNLNMKDLSYNKKF